MLSILMPEADPWIGSFVHGFYKGMILITVISVKNKLKRFSS